jgi:hypothetical protein
MGSARVGEITFAVGGGHFQLVTVCYQLTALFGQTAFEHLPILSGRLIIRLRQHPDNVHDRKPPRLGRLVVVAADFVAFKNNQFFFHGDGMRLHEFGGIFNR